MFRVQSCICRRSNCGPSELKLEKYMLFEEWFLAYREGRGGRENRMSAAARERNRKPTFSLPMNAAALERNRKLTSKQHRCN